MGASTSIAWCHSTFNAWIGCHKVSPACQHCYAEAFAKRTGKKVWGLKAPRYFVGEDSWKKPLRWNREAERASERRRVFCGSMMDVFEEHSLGAISTDQNIARRRLWRLIIDTPWLDWLLLTKRPENAEAVLPLEWWRDGLPPNVWMGTTVENQEYADLRIPHLLKIPARVRFLSCEPLLGPIDLSIPLQLGRCRSRGAEPERFRCGLPDGHEGNHHALIETGAPWFGMNGLHWVIAGGESGAHHREHHLEHSRSLRDQCAAAGVAFFFKQLGESATEPRRPSEDAMSRLLNPDRATTRFHLQLKLRSKGESLDEIPPDLRIRQFPQPKAHQ
jgi:protein gp37